MFDELDESALVTIVVAVVVIAVLAYRLTSGGRRKSVRQTAEELEESTPLIDNEAQRYINKLRQEMSSAGIQLGGEFEYKMAQAHLKRQKAAQASDTVRQRSGRDPRTV